MPGRRLLLAFAFALLTLCPTARGYEPVQVYDHARDAAQDVANAVVEAKRTGRHVLVEVGGKWCIWCRYLDEFFAGHAKINELLDRSFILVKVNFSEENKNEELLSSYPKIPGYPHFFVLDGEGKLTRSQGTAELEEGKSYSPAAMKSFLTSYGPRKH